AQKSKDIGNKAVGLRSSQLVVHPKLNHGTNIEKTVLGKNYHSKRYSFHRRQSFPLPYRWSEGNGFTSQAIGARKNQLKELELYLLPLLRQQITNLSNHYTAYVLQQLNQWILEIQSEIATTTNQIEDTLNQLCCKESNASPHNEEDQDRKEFKYFRTVGLDDQWKYDACSSKDDSDPIYRFIAFESNQQTAPPYQSHHSQLLRHILLVLKLSKLFFTKLSDRAINNNHDLLESSFTRINSKHLTKLLNLYSMVHYCIHEIADIIAHRNYAFPSIGQKIESLKTCFETPLSLVSNHFLPMIKARSDGLSAQDYYQDWLVTWSVQYNLAIQHFKDAFQSSSSDHS
ncbi:hypothetical protein MJO28_006929, partial [Puccinia striiformis f. sp. tritici]